MQSSSKQIEDLQFFVFRFTEAKFANILKSNSEIRKPELWSVGIVIDTSISPIPNFIYSHSYSTIQICIEFISKNLASKFLLPAFIKIKFNK